MEKLKVNITVPEGAKMPSEDDLIKAAQAADWSDDPGTGKAILLPDANGNPAYEVINPMPFAPPIGFEPTPPIDQLIADRVRVELSRLRDDEEIDDIVDAEDFDVPDELPPLETIYEFIAMEREAPAVKSEPTREERAKADAEYLELVERERLLKKRHREAALKKAREEMELYGPPDNQGGEEKGG